MQKFLSLILLVTVTAQGAKVTDFPNMTGAKSNTFISVSDGGGGTKFIAYGQLERQLKTNTVSGATNAQRSERGDSLFQLVGATAYATNPIVVIASDEGAIERDGLSLPLALVNGHLAGIFDLRAFTTPIGAANGGIYTNSAISLEVMMRDAGLKIPIGINRGAEGQGHNDSWGYWANTNFPHSGMSDKYAASSRLWRQTLVNAPDNSVVPVVGGGLWDVKYFLESPGDTISPLTGYQLEAQKIKFWFLAMGNNPSETNSPYGSAELNLTSFSGSSADIIATMTNKLVYFSGVDGVYADGIFTNFLAPFNDANRGARFAPDSLYKRVLGVTVPGGFPWGDTLTPLLTHPEVFNYTTGRLHLANWGGSFYTSQWWETNASMNHVFLRLKTNAVATWLPIMDRAINQPYPSRLRAFDEPSPIMAVTNSGTDTMFVSNGVSGGMQVLVGPKVSLGAGEFGAPDGKRFNITTNTVYAAANFSTRQKISWSSDAQWWGTPAFWIEENPDMNGFGFNGNIATSGGVFVTNNPSFDAIPNNNALTNGFWIKYAAPNFYFIAVDGAGNRTTNKVTTTPGL